MHNMGKASFKHKYSLEEGIGMVYKEYTEKI